MNKKYKLIKSWPHCNWKLGDVIEETERGDRYTGHNYNFFGNPSLFPEFWEEVVEKDYEILSFKNIGSDTLMDKRSNGKFVHCDTPGNGIYTEKQLLKNEGTSLFGIKPKGYAIYSVKRLSDGEIFAIGDKIDSTLSDLGRATKLTGFKVLEKNNRLVVGLRDLGYYPLNTILVVKKPLFTTEDGVEIFKNDEKLFEVILNNFHINENIPLAACNDFLDKRNDGYPSKVFSTKQAAEEYILMNKPCLSINDLQKIKIVDNYDLSIEIEVEDLIQLVKQKLK